MRFRAKEEQSMADDPPTQPAAPSAPPAKKRGCLFYGLIGLAVVIVLWLLGGQQQEQDKVERVAVAAGTSESSLPVIDVTARAMQRQFADNEVSAKALYEGKRARVTGTLASIDLDFSDDPMLIL